MTVRIYTGIQYGDEGKGKEVDIAAKDADIIARWGGGPNAGHTVYDQGRKFILHHLPSGILRAKTCVMGNGMVIDLDKLKEEVGELEKAGYNVRDNLLISGNAHIILPDHVQASLNDLNGSTGRGIQGAYAAKADRAGLRMRDILHLDWVLDRFDLNARPALEKHREFLQTHSDLAPYIADTTAFLNDAVKKGKNIILEGAQATGLDLDHGQYPFITSSNPTAGGACVGTGIPPTAIDEVIGVAKAYVTRVDREGAAPLVTQFDDEVAKRIRDVGNEYGATTGRPRRIGWFDIPLAEHAIAVNGVSRISLTKLDVLTGVDPIQVCVIYKRDGEKVPNYPTDAAELRRCTSVNVGLPGWTEPINDIRTFGDLPVQAQNFVLTLEDMLQTVMNPIGVGPEPHQLIDRS